MGRKVEVTHVIDGDTFVGKNGGEKEEFFRLSGVDTPEKGQAGYGMAKSALEELIGGETVSVDESVTGHYGRSIVDVETSGGESVNNAMKRYGKK